MGITNACLNEISGLVGNIGTKTAFGYVATGSGTTAFAANQTTLVTEIATAGLSRVAVTPTQATVTQTNDTIQWQKTFTVTGSATVAEVGVFNAASTGTMGSRFKLGTARSLVNGDTYTLTIRWTFA